MTPVVNRLLVGFGAGALSHLLFQGALGTALFATDLAPALIWSVEPVPPLGVPTTLNNMFWDGLWGMLYGALAPWLVARLGRVGSGAVLGLSSLLIFWLLVLPLKGSEITALHGPDLAIDIAFDLVFGIGTALLYWAGTRVASSVSTR